MSVILILNAVRPDTLFFKFCVWFSFFLQQDCREKGIQESCSRPVVAEQVCWQKIHRPTETTGTNKFVMIHIRLYHILLGGMDGFHPLWYKDTSVLNLGLPHSLLLHFSLCSWPVMTLCSQREEVRSSNDPKVFQTSCRGNVSTVKDFQRRKISA